MAHPRGKLFALCFLTLLALGACQLPASNSTCNTTIDWVNFIKVGSIVYTADLQNSTPLLVSDLGPIDTHVKFKVDGHVCDPHYQLKDGDAAFLAPGTAIYQVSAYSPTQALAAYFNGQLLLYVATASS